MREVYIGNGETIFVNPSKASLKEFDWNKLQQYLDSGVSVEAGMKEDWYWTACNLKQTHINDKKVAGISYSDWATPSVKINNGGYVDCYIQKDMK